MSRRKSNTLGTIEYIGPRPQKPQKRPNFLGGWVVLLIAAAAVYFFGKPFLPLLMAQQAGPTSERVGVLIAELQPSAKLGDRLAAAALQRTQSQVSYEDAYYKIDFPNGDIPPDKGRAEDVVIRSYRALGIDLQQLVHHDMDEHFADYPQIFSRKSADRNIDHRLAPNLQRYFRRAGAELLDQAADGEHGPSLDPAAYQVGDLVIWRLTGGRCHIGVVVPGPGDHHSKPWVVHNIGSGPVWEDCLFDFRIDGHFRFTGEPLEKD